MPKKKRAEIMKGTMFGEFRIESFIGAGSFGDIYSCIEEKTGEKWAIKLEFVDCEHPSLEHEVKILQKLNNSPYFPKFRAYGETEKFKYCVMELLGPSLGPARRVSYCGQFTESTVLRLGIEMLKCVEAFHSFGYLHRDLKPGNFLIRPSRAHPLALIDFGLSRRYLEENGELREPRTCPGFVGTVPYASINSHKGLELGRCDDLFSWFAILLKNHTGDLPWPCSNDKAIVYPAKRDADLSRFCVGLPSQYLTIYRIILGMKREDTPNYAVLYQLLAQAMIEAHASFLDKYDWESVQKRKLAFITSISLDMPKNEQPEPPNLEKEILDQLMVPPDSSSYSSSSTTSDYEEEVEEEAVGGCPCYI